MELLEEDHSDEDLNSGESGKDESEHAEIIEELERLESINGNPKTNCINIRKYSNSVQEIFRQKGFLYRSVENDTNKYNIDSPGPKDCNVFICKKPNDLEVENHFLEIIR